MHLIFGRVGKFILIPIGALLLLGAAYSVWSTRTWLKTAVEAEGTVIEMVRTVSTSTVEDPFDRTKRTVSNGYVYAPLVKFRSFDGIMVEFQSTLRSNPPAYHTGQTVTVLYDPKAPNSAEIRGFAALWIAPIILGIIGTAFGVMGGVFTVIGHKLEKHMATVEHADPRQLWEQAEAADAAEAAREMKAAEITPAARP